MANNEYKIWAKSPNRNSNTGISLKKHIEDILSNLNSLKNLISDNKLFELIKISSLLHDFGKALPSFQIRTLGNKNYKPFDVCSKIPHSIFSLFMIDKEKLKEEVEKIIHDKTEDYTKYILSVVAYHHWRSNFSEVIRYSSDDIENLINSNLPKKIEENLINDLSNILNGYKGIIKFDKSMALEILNGAQIQDYAIPPYNLYWLPKRIEFGKTNLDDWIKIAGFLMRCDHFASFCEMEENFNLEIEIAGKEYSAIKQKLVEQFELNNENEIWQVKLIEEKQLHNKNVVFVAPTGSGKTEFSYIWSKGEKTFYTLPLRSAVNQIYKRSKNLFNDKIERVGLLHSDADVYLLGDGNESENLQSYSLSRQLSYPFMVSTGDQFFPYALRPPSYEKIYATFSYSRLIIDEVQAYNPKAAAIIVKYLEDINKMGGKFLLITATMPKFILYELKDRIKNNNSENQDFEIVDYYQLGGYNDIVKHKIQFELIKNKFTNEKVTFNFDEKFIDKIIEESKENNGQRILVVVNTVKLAINTYKKIKEKVKNEFFVELLHSRLTFDIRKIKEKKIEEEFRNPKPNDENKPKIVIATQVIEASLDLDADVLFTEFAPVDSLVQRMGRVVRRYKNKSNPSLESPNVFITIFENGVESAGKRVYSNDLIEISLKLFSEVNHELESSKWLDDKKNYKKKSKDWRSKKTVDNFFKAIKKFDDDKFYLSEIRKKELVEELYNPKYFASTYSYLSDFYQTLDILDAGFMAERKEDAQRIFREISSISVIPLSVLKDENNLTSNFLLDLKKFFNSNSNKISFTKFKSEILNKYIINVPFSNWQFNNIKFREDLKLENWIEDNVDFISSEEKKLLRMWMKNIWIIKTKNKYDSSEGIFEFEFPEFNNFI